ncbi:hypothetical protein Aab01nite_78030 [Paractinoplanes abujensis]|uniref:CubicO group peptidase (Beta-lactamase class C family) n=1 Tax=Paractinoplanes abujensis TaxID=882441 RepID=A0A7W7CPE9_9ACTN|nr:serine hydrolase domain-containing protein [Actinoplanes abujensis]MBB4692309.1 CubicO group peptidase (beta-lactamase class C family) [Actinoplanes abujensis]GID24213.1 hypothetical protein Aab01nite_78030 [Actinoplanes abujensis]
MPALLPRSAPAAAGVSSRALGAVLDRLEAESAECHSLMVVRGGHVVAEGWWAPYTAERPHLLYSLTKSFTSAAVGLAIADGLLALGDRVVDVLPEHVPAGIAEQGRRLTVHHLLSMTAGHGDDSLAEAWQLEPGDLTRGFLRVPFPYGEGTRHTYDNATTYVLARMVERVTGRGLPEFLQERLFTPMGIEPPDWDRVAGGAVFGFHGLHLTTEAVAAFGELLRRDGGGLIPSEWVRLATRRHIDTLPLDESAHNSDWLHGYGYQFWMSRHGFRGDGAYGQLCLVVPEHELVVAATAAMTEAQVMFDALWDCLLPGLDRPDGAADDDRLAERLRGLALPMVAGTAGPGATVTATVDGNDVLPGRTPVTVEPVRGGWRLRFGSLFVIAAGHGQWRESAPLGRPVMAAGAWQGDTFVADLCVITTPHRVRLTVTAGTATVAWNVEPLTGPRLELHLREPLLTRPDVA